MTNENTDNTDEPSKAELHDRVQQLESTVAKMMPSRRDALKLGAAGIAGAAGLSATSQSAEASTGSAGDIGAPNNRPDLFADTVDTNSLTGSAGFIKTKTRAFLSTNSSANPIPFDSVSYDPDGNFDTTSHEYTVPANGTYLVTSHITVANSNSSGIEADFRVLLNGSNIAFHQAETTGSTPTVSVTDVRELSSGDILKVENKVAVDVQATDQNTFFTIVRLA